MSSIWNMGTINCCVIDNNRGYIGNVLILAVEPEKTSTFYAAIKDNMNFPPELSNFLP